MSQNTQVAFLGESISLEQSTGPVAMCGDVTKALLWQILSQRVAEHCSNRLASENIHDIGSVKAAIC